MSLNKRPSRLRCASRHTQAPHALNVFAKPHHVSRGAGSFGSIGESFLRFDFLFVFLASGCHLCGNQPVRRMHDNSSLSHFSAMTRPSWLGRAVTNRHRHAIEQASRRWRGGRRDGSARTRRKVLISAQVATAAATLFLESSCRSGRRCLVDTPCSPVPEQPAPNPPAGTRVCPPNFSPNLYRSGTGGTSADNSYRSAPSTRPGPGCPARPVWKSTSASGALTILH